MRSILLSALTLLAATQIIGCSRAVSAPNPIAIAPAEYHRMFDASVDVLRNHKFIVDRKDRRFGIVTSRPQVASSILEPWQTDNSTPIDYAENTINYQRRTVRVELRPVTAQPAAPQPNSAAPAPSTPPVADSPAEFELAVTVTVDRLYHPPIQLYTSALQTFNFRHQRTRYRDVTSEYGVDSSYWQPVGRDEELEKRLLAEIVRSATFNTGPTRFEPLTPATPTPAEPQK